MTKRFWLFAFEQYYPYGGMSDCLGRFATLEEATAFWETHEDREDHVCAYVVDAGTGEKVSELVTVWLKGGLTKSPL